MGGGVQEPFCQLVIALHLSLNASRIAENVIHAWALQFLV